MNPLQVVHFEQRFAVGGVELFIEAHIAIQKGAVDAVTVGLREACAFFRRQSHEGNGFAGTLAGGFEGVAELRDEFFGNECGGHVV